MVFKNGHISKWAFWKITQKCFVLGMRHENWLRRMCNLVVLIKLILSQWKMLIFRQVIGKNVPLRTNYSIHGHTFFSHNSAILWPIGVIFLWELRRLLYIDFWWEIMIFIFLNPLFSEKMGVAALLAPKGLGPTASRPNWKIDPPEYLIYYIE